MATQLWSDETAQASPASTYVVVEQARPDAASSHGVSGIVQSAQPMQVGAVTGGRVVQLLVNVGDPVIEGQVLAILDGRIAGFRQAQAESEVRRAAIVATERAAAARRAEALVGSGAMSAAERDAARAEAQAASNALAAARAASGIARAEAEHHVIRAPGSGVISSRSVELGAAVAPGQTLLTIDSRKGGMIMAALPAKLAPTVRPGDRVVYRTDAGEGSARVIGASPRIEAGGVAPVRLRSKAVHRCRARSSGYGSAGRTRAATLSGCRSARSRPASMAVGLSTRWTPESRPARAGPACRDDRRRCPGQRPHRPGTRVVAPVPASSNPARPSASRSPAPDPRRLHSRGFPMTLSSPSLTGARLHGPGSSSSPACSPA
jgi:biotin carboxyl carrier protein